MAAPVSSKRIPNLLPGISRWFRKFWALVLLVLIGMTVSLVNVAGNPANFSPYDEWVYYDYVTKVPSQLFVRQGEPIGEPALEAMACQGDGYGPRGEPCTGPNGIYDKPSLYPQGGITSADPYTPAYFAPTWAAGKVIEFVTGASFLTSARATGALWLAGGLIMLFMLFREFRLRNVTSLALGLVVVGTTHFVYTYITTDATSLVVGATVAFIGAKFARTGNYGWWLIPIAAVGTWLKVTNLLPIGLVALALIIYAAISKFGPSAATLIGRRFKLVRIAVLAAITGVVAEVMWLVFRHLERVGDSPDQGVSNVISPRSLFSGLFTFFYPYAGVNALSKWSDLITAPLIALTIVGVFGWFLMSRGTGLNRAWSIATVVSITLFAPMLSIAFQLLMGTAAPVSTRYAFGLQPMYLVGIALVTRNAIGPWLILIYGVVLSIANLLGLFR